MVENKNKIPTFWVENKNVSQNFVIALKNFFLPGSIWEKNSRIRIRKKRIRIRNTEFTLRIRRTVKKYVCELVELVTVGTVFVREKNVDFDT